MGNIVKRDGFVYEVVGDKGFETFYNLGKDINDPRWKEDEEDEEELEIVEKEDDIIEIKPKKGKKKQKSED